MAARRAVFRLLPASSPLHQLRPAPGTFARLPSVARKPAQPSFRFATPSVVISARAYSQTSQSKIWDFEAVRTITQDAKPSVIIVDTREPSELQDTGRIPGAVNIPIASAPDSFHIAEDEFEDRFGYARPGRDAEVVFYCKAGVRSRAAAGLARDAGWTRVGEYPGSWVDWAERGGKVQR